MKNDIVAILCSDLHLSHRPPVARSAELDWYLAMKRPLDQLAEIAKKANYPPIVYLGDIFHNWNSPSELINFALQYLPPGYSIAGNHDLPHHSYRDIKKSSYWTLVGAKKVIHLKNEPTTIHKRVCAIGVSCGQDIPPFEVHCRDSLHLAAIHRYVWVSGCSFPTAPNEGYVKNLAEQLKGYDVAATGDNHIGFLSQAGETTVFNCGSLMCRNSDQRDYKPQVGLLYEDGTVIPHNLDTSKDKWLDVTEMTKHIEKADFKELMKQFKNLSVEQVDFIEMLKKIIKSKTRLSKATKEIIQELIEKELE